ncbi:MAG: hypothetical protein ACI84E_002290, partial [Planctomycetota bacterium]
EEDMAELSGDGYLMLCRDRQLLFAEGCSASPMKLAEVESIQAMKGALQVTNLEGDMVDCPFPGASKEELQSAASKLNQCLAQWR